MLLAVSLLMAAASAQQPWVEMSAGPVLLHESGRAGIGTGPLLRIDLGYPLSDRAAAEAWLSGTLESAPMGSPGDRAILGAGAAGRFLLTRLDGEGKVGLWAHAGAGWGALAAGTGTSGATGFAGALISFQPFIRRFQLGLEMDAVAYRRAFGIAVMPSLRCTF
jgi:hypothetical protein